MNEFVAKKLGEVFAFVTLVIDTYDKGEKGFLKELNPTELKARVTEISAIRDAITDIAKQSDQYATMLTKSEQTLGKITKARDEYIAERWDDTVELYEWFSFNSGAGAAHANEVLGASIALQNEPLRNITSQTLSYFDQLLEDCKNYLYKIGSERAIS